MNLRHGHLWQRLGLTVVSGIVATFLAPAALAAPVDEQGAQSDSGITDSQVSRSEEEAQSGSAAVDQASARDADTAEAATASSEERAEEGGIAQVLTFPGTSGPTRIHILSTAGRNRRRGQGRHRLGPWLSEAQRRHLIKPGVLPGHARALRPYRQRRRHHLRVSSPGDPHPRILR